MILKILVFSGDDFWIVWIQIFGIHHRRILWSSYRKLPWVGFEPTTTGFHLDALTDWAIRPWVQLAIRANFVQLLQFHYLFSITLHILYTIYILFNVQYTAYVHIQYMYIYIHIYIYVCVCVCVCVGVCVCVCVCVCLCVCV